jgi:hypothetical protein
MGDSTFSCQTENAEVNIKAAFGDKSAEYLNLRSEFQNLNW